MAEPRDIFTDPQPGDRLHSTVFGGGCTFIVRRRMFRKGWGQAVQVELISDVGSVLKPRLRVYSLRSWASLADISKEPTHD